MTRRVLAASVALLSFATLVPLVAVECALRLRGSVPASIFRPDTLVMYSLVPGGRKTFAHGRANGGATTDIRINADGFRGPPVRRAGTAFRVMVYGDSFIEGEFADDSGTFTRMLERRLSGRQPTEAINAGVVGWGPDQAYRRMQRELPIYSPKLVVLGIFADNDLGDMIRNRILRLAPDSTLEIRRPLVHPRLVSLLAEQAYPQGWRRLHLVRWVERKLGRAPGSMLPKIRQQRELKSMANYDDWAMDNARQQWSEFNAIPDTVFDFFGDSYDIDVAATPDAPSAHYKVALIDRLLGVMQRDLATRQTPFVVMVIPSPLDICPTYDVKIDSTKYPGYDRRRISAAVQAAAARHGIRHIDLWTPFGANDPCSLYFRRGDLHWNGKGQAVAARVLVDSLAAWHITP
jgi:hypothetical protein